MNRALWDVIQTLFPQTAATAPPETPLAEQQQQLVQRSGTSRPTAPSNRSRLWGSTTAAARSFVPPRPMQATAARLPPTTATASTFAMASHQNDIDQLTEALGGLEVIDLTQEHDMDEVENNEPLPVATAVAGGSGNASSYQHAVPAVPPPQAQPQQQRQQRRPFLAPTRYTNWDRQSGEVPLTAAVRPKRVVSGLFYTAAPSHQQ